jgi:tRNA (guanine26-N2/guanine27-N2)-dimethyltransferase
MYGGPIHNAAFIERILAHVGGLDKNTYGTKDRLEGMLHTARDEITFGVSSSESSESSKTNVLDPIIPPVDSAEIEHHPFYFTPSNVSRILHCQAPPSAAFRGALKHAGFRVTMSHCKPGTIRTDASWTDIWHIMREWIRQKAPLVNKLKEGAAGRAILEKGTGDLSPFLKKGTEEAPAVEKGGHSSTPENDVGSDAAGKLPAEDERSRYLESSFNVVFDVKLGKDQDKGKYVRYQLAPRENWGPMTRAK